MKGGDLKRELSRIFYDTYYISNYFEEYYFEEKKIIYIAY